MQTHFVCHLCTKERARGIVAREVSLYGVSGDKQCCSSAISFYFLNDEVCRNETSVVDTNDVRKKFKTGSCPS